MDESTMDAVVNELIEKAVSHLEPVCVQLGDALGNLEDREVLGAIGALTGCEEAINRANLVLIIARDYAEKLARARAAVAGIESQSETSRESEPSKGPVSTQENPHAAIEVVLPEAAFEKLEEIDIIASGYEFECPCCNTQNTLIAIPKHGTAVECHHCHKLVRVDEINHARD